MTTLEAKALAMFDASTMFGTWKAADQDGYDGGYVASDGENEAWGETPEKARRAFEQHFHPVTKMGSETNPERTEPATENEHE